MPPHDAAGLPACAADTRFPPNPGATPAVRQRTLGPPPPRMIRPPCSPCAPQLDEEGTEAAAATAAVIKTKDILAGPPVLRYDRPLSLACVHEPAGEVLLTGEVYLPGEGPSG